MTVLRVCIVAACFQAAVGIASGQEDPAPDVKLLVKALGHPDSSIRQKARQQLEAEGANAASALAKEVCQADMRQAVAAAHVLAVIGTDARSGARSALAGLIEDSHTPPWRWSLAADVLARVDPNRTGLLPRFVEGLAAESPLVQYASVKAIAAMAPSASNTQPQLLANARQGLLDLLERPRRPFTEFLIAYADPVSQLVTFRATTPWRDDFEIIDALMKVGLEREKLRELLIERSEPELKVVQPGYVEFAGIAPYGCQSCLAATVYDGHGSYGVTITPSDHVRLLAAKRLIDLDEQGRQKAATILAEIIQDPYSRARPEAIKTAVRLDDDGAAAAPALAGVLFEEDADLREPAARALGNMGPAAKAHLPQLRKALEFELLRGRTGTKIRVIEAMEEAIEKIGGPSDPPSSE